MSNPSKTEVIAFITKQNIQLDTYNYLHCKGARMSPEYKQTHKYTCEKEDYWSCQTSPQSKQASSFKKKLNKHPLKGL